MNWSQLRNLPVTLLLKSPLHPLISGSVLLLTVKGRKSGRSYTFPANYVSNRDELFIVSRPGRTWWRNVGDGAEVHLRLEGHPFVARGEVLTDPVEKRDAVLALVHRAPHFAAHLGVAFGRTGEIVERSELEACERDLVLIRLSQLRANHWEGPVSVSNGVSPT